MLRPVSPADQWLAPRGRPSRVGFGPPGVSRGQNRKNKCLTRRVRHAVYFTPDSSCGTVTVAVLAVLLPALSVAVYVTV